MRKKKIFVAVVVPAVVLVYAMLFIDFKVKAPHPSATFDVLVDEDLKYLDTVDAVAVFSSEATQKLVGLDYAGATVFEVPLQEKVEIHHGIIKCISSDGSTSYYDANGTSLPSSSFAQGYDRKFTDATLIPCEDEDGQWGYVSPQGKWILPPEYSYAREFSEGFAYVEKADGPGAIYGFIDSEGHFEELCIRASFGDTTFSDGRLLGQVMINKQTYSTYVTTENHILPFEFEDHYNQGFPYQEAKPFSNGFAAIQFDGKWGYIDTTGAVLVAPRFAEAYSFKNGYAVVVKQNGSFGCINTNGNEVHDFIDGTEYAPTGVYDSGLYIVNNKDNAKMNIVDINGKKVLAVDIDHVWAWNTEIACWDVGSGFYLPPLRKLLPGVEFNELESCIVTNSQNIYDKNTGILIASFPLVHSFHEGVAAAQGEYRKYGYINTKGEWLIPPVYDKAFSVHQGVAVVQSGNQQGFIKVIGDA